MEVIGRGLLGGTIHVFALEEMRKTTKTLLKITGVSVKIRTGYLLIPAGSVTASSNFLGS
jgi:hypothetical protein